MTTVFFATNRKLVAGPEFSSEFDGRLDELRFGKVDFSGTELFKQDADALGQQGRIQVADEQMNAVDGSLSQVGSKAIFSEVRAGMQASQDAVIYLHGYNYTFRAAAARAAQLQQWLAAGGCNLLMFMFAWPSEGAGVAPRTYSDDRERAKCSGIALARALLKAADFIRNTPRAGRCDGRIHLIAHSMGNWALRGAVQAMRTFVGDNIPPLFEEVLLVAADEDDDTLTDPKKMAQIARGCRRVTVYYNQQDLALKSSDVAMGNPDRLGRSGPQNRPGLQAKIVPVNVSPAIIREATGPQSWTQDETGHQYYRNNAVVRADLVQVLQGKLDIDGRIKREDYYRLG